MASSQRTRSRRPHARRDREPRYVAPVLDPTWVSPYTPTPAERHRHAAVVRAYALRRRLVASVAAGAAVVALAILAVALSAWLWFAAVALGVLYAIDLRRVVAGYAVRAHGAAGALLARFTKEEDPVARERLATLVDRLSATFGVDGVRAEVVRDAGYNAALVPGPGGLVMIATSALVQDFALIEIEGVVAHCLARERTGVLERECVAALDLAGEPARLLAGPGETFRADEVAAATIRYPLGIAAALRRCRAQTAPAGSFLADPAFEAWRWVFFNPWSDRRESVPGDLDDPEVRARALEEW
ncbi:MAG: hypothetical protein ACYCPK_06195 [Acidimicrobiales bacterium]